MKIPRITIAIVAIIGMSLAMIGCATSMSGSGPLADSLSRIDANKLRYGQEAQYVVERYRAEHGKYPLGEDLVLGGIYAQCLGKKGFATMCGDDQIAKIPPSPRPRMFEGLGLSDNVLYRSDGDTYEIELNFEQGFSYVLEDGTDRKVLAGRHLLTRDGLKQYVPIRITLSQ